MNAGNDNKMTPDEIAARFDAEVARFSNIETGQTATMDAPLVLDLVTGGIAARHPEPSAVLDIGCGAGNYTVRLIGRLKSPGDVAVTALDLSANMLEAAAERIGEAGAASVRAVQGDVRSVDLPDDAFDCVIAAAVLHHLRDESEWGDVFARIYRWLKPGGSVWIADLVDHDDPAIARLMWNQYDAYLIELGGVEYRDTVRAYIAAEDSPRSVEFQIARLRAAGFSDVTVLHQHACFAAFTAHKLQ